MFLLFIGAFCTTRLWGIGFMETALSVGCLFHWAELLDVANTGLFFAPVVG
jgi:hypothetical protein